MSSLELECKMSKAQAIGIDLGTTYCCVSAFQNGKHEIIKTHTGQNTMASFVSFTKQGRIIGDEAKENSIMYPTETVFGVKRFIGRRFEDETLQQNINTYPFEIINDKGNPKIQVHFRGENKVFWPEEISAMILEKLKENANKHLGNEVKKAVITVPAHFNDSQRQATKDAGRIAGLEVLRIINEPTAAALAYGIDRKYKNNDKPCNVLIYDFGGGTFDVSIISIDDGIFEVKATNGDTHLGGDDIDLSLVNFFAEEFKGKFKKDLRTDKRAIRRLRMKSENLKRQLSTSHQATIEIDSLCEGHDFYSGMSRSHFESMCADIFRKTLHYVQEALNDANMKVNDIDEVILIGGSTRIPKVQEMVKRYFHGININTSLNPDEAVAIGASVQAAILDGEQDESIGTLLLVDVNSLSLGIDTLGGVMSVVVPRNTQIPVQIDRNYETAHDYQKSLRISVYEGERKQVASNNLLGQFQLNDIKAARRGETKIVVTFEINTNGILHVTAQEKDAAENCKTLQIQMEKSRLTEEDIKKKIEEAEIYKRDDLKWESITQAKNKLKFYCSDVKLRVEEEFARQMSAEHKQIIELKCEEAMKWLERNSNGAKEEYEKKQKEVYNVCNPIIRQYL